MSAGERARLHATARGRVQGVGYRMFAADGARRLGLDGYVRNLPDGHTVEVVAEGERAALEELLALLRRGPRMARVEGVGASWGPASDNLQPFEPRP